MALYLVDQASVGCYLVSIKFGRTIKISSLNNENFKLYKDTATPTLVSAPFVLIDTIKDYNQISRIITLYWRTSLDNNQDYYIDVVNLIDSSGVIVGSEKVKFTYKTSSTPSTQPFQAPELVPILIEDKSIKKGINHRYLLHIRRR